MGENTFSGATIRLFLLSGDPSGIKIGDIPAAWTGKVYFVPRDQINSLANRPECKNAGVYFLLGADPEDRYKQRVYIGQTNNVLDRLVEHQNDPKKDYFNDVIFIVSTDLTLSATHTTWLEAKLIESARKISIYTLDNIQRPTVPEIAEQVEAETAYYFDKIKLLLPLFGVTLFEEETRTVSPDQPIQVVANANDVVFVYDLTPVKAKLVINEDGFVVRAGSYAKKQQAETLQANYSELRRDLVDKGTLKDSAQEANCYEFTVDCAFSSMSAATACISGYNSGGYDDWMIEGTSKTYRTFKQEQSSPTPVNGQ